MVSNYVPACSKFYEINLFSSCRPKLWQTKKKRRKKWRACCTNFQEFGFFLLFHLSAVDKTNQKSGNTERTFQSSGTFSVNKDLELNRILNQQQNQPIFEAHARLARPIESNVIFVYTLDATLLRILLR